MVDKLNYILEKKQKQSFLLLFILTIIGAGFELIGVSSMLPLISVISNKASLYNNEYLMGVCNYLNIHSYEEVVLMLCIFIISVIAMKNLYMILYTNYKIKFDYKNREIVSSKLMRGYLNRSYLYHVNHSVAVLQRNVIGDVTSLFQVVTAFMNLLIEALTVIFLIGFLVAVDWKTTLLVVIVLGILLTIIRKIDKYYLVKAGELSREAAADLNRWVIQPFSGIKDIKVTGREEYFWNKFYHAMIKSNLAGARYNRFMYYPKYIIETVCICGLIMAIAIRILMGVDPEIFLVTVTSMGVAAIRILPSVNRISEYLGTISYGKSALEKVYSDLVQSESFIKKCECAKEKISITNLISLKNISYRYEDNDKMILDSVNLEIKKHQTIAFVGQSGAGKTTLADLILGLLFPVRGEILVDGKNVQSIMDKWHNSIGYIPQNIYLLDASIRENILFGLNEDADEQKIWKVLESAQIADFIRGLPDGLETQIGDAGMRLSGGQRQRIGIARALYNEPDFLVLDEATSALDNDTEKAVMDSINMLKGNVTMIIIAHRLSTVKQCDAIYRVENGGITEVTWDQLNQSN